MRIRVDSISSKILKYLAEAGEPLETKEVEQKLPDITRTKILYRLNRLRGDGLIMGKAVGSGKGAWIWWMTGLFDSKDDGK
jgi:DNA-binding Lrp family transcriptional regulator